jgi:hypothetical protein
VSPRSLISRMVGSVSGRWCGWSPLPVALGEGKRAKGYGRAVPVTNSQLAMIDAVMLAQSLYKHEPGPAPTWPGSKPNSHERGANCSKIVSAALIP